MRGRFFRATAPLKKRFLLAFLFFGSLTGTTLAAPTIGIGPVLDVTSYSYPLIYYGFNSKENARFGLGITGHYTMRFFGTVGLRVHATYILYETIVDDYIIPDENPYIISDGTLETTTTMSCNKYGADLLFGLGPPFYLLTGVTMQTRHWHTNEYVQAPTKFIHVFEPHHFEESNNERAFGVSLGIGMRTSRRFTVEGKVLVDEELTHFELSINYLAPLTFLEKKKR